jgi:hypothetical protein
MHPLPNNIIMPPVPVNPVNVSANTTAVVLSNTLPSFVSTKKDGVVPFVQHIDEIYKTYAVKLNKPFIITGTSACYRPNVPASSTNPTNAEFKGAWFSQIFNATILSSYNLTKGVVVRNINSTLGSTEFIPGSGVCDFSVTDDMAVRDVLRAMVKPLVGSGSVANGTVTDVTDTGKRISNTTASVLR